MFSSDFSNLKEAFLHETNTKLGLFGSINLVYLETSSKGECSIVNPSSVLLFAACRLGTQIPRTR